MRIKKAILQSPFIIIAFVLIMSIIGIIFVDILTQDENIDIIEDEIVLEPYSDYDFSKLYNSGLLAYEDDKYTSMCGIDVAAHQETIDWAKVKEAGVEFAYIRLGYRSAINGQLMQDIEFYNNYKGALENDIKIGIYWYSQPINEKEAKMEAEYVLSILEDKHIDLPIAYDFEETEFSDGRLSRMHDMSKEDRTKMAKTFCEEINKNGYETIIYTNLYWANNFYNWKELSNYPVWFAQYADYPEFDLPYVMWQYTDKGKVDGIEHFVDLDILFIRKNDQN